MEWIILFGVSWCLFFLLADRKKLKRNIWCGVMAVILQLSIDTQAISHGFYEIHKCMLCILGSSALFIFGPVFVIGTLLAQYHPKGYKIRIANVFMLTALFTAQELLLQTAGALVYTNWHIMNSLQVNISAMILLSWFSMIVVQKEGS